MLTLLFENKLFIAPIAPGAQNVLNIGTRMGIWAMYNNSICLSFPFSVLSLVVFFPEADILAVILLRNAHQLLLSGWICPRSSQNGSR